MQNTSASEARTFDVTGQVAPSVGNTSGWSPLAATAVAGSPFLVAASGEASVMVNVSATDAANVPPVGTIGEIVSVATVIVDGNPLEDIYDVLKVITTVKGGEVVSERQSAGASTR